MSQVTGADILCASLKAEGVDLLFDLPGDPMGPILMSCYQQGIERYSIFRHEQAAALAAQAWSYITRRIGVALVASGPGMTNALTALETARTNCWPTLLIGGSSELRRRGRGDFQEAPQVEAAAPFCKLAVSVPDPRSIPFLVQCAIRTAMSGRPGPVYLDLPADVISAAVDADEIRYLPHLDPPQSMADSALVDAALVELQRAARPLLLIGKGAAWADAANEARAFVDRFQIPFVPSPMGKGVIPDDHPLCVAAARSYALRHADLILLLGARLNWIFHFGEAPRFAPDVKVVQIDIDPPGIGCGTAPTVGLAGDAQLVMRQLVDAAGPKPITPAESPWLQGLAAERTRNRHAVAALANADASPINLYRMFRDIDDVLDRDATLTIDGERTMAVSRAMASAYLPRHRLDAGTSGCMGVAVPYAIGAQVARPGRQVLSINGDWAFGFNGMEVETAVRYNLPIVFLVANNGTTGLINSARIFAIASGDPFDVVRYDRVMEAFGGHAELVETTAQFRPALERAFASGRTALINVVVDPTADRKPQAFDWLSRDNRMKY